MEYFQKLKLLVLALYVLKSSGRNPVDKGDKKHLIMYHPKPHQSGKLSRVILYFCNGVTITGAVVESATLEQVEEHSILT